jgi:putative heme transporter
MNDPLSPSRLVRTVAIIVTVCIGFWALYLARRALLLIYISVLLAIGLTPLVRFIERLQLTWVGIRRVPRWLAILVLYLGVVAVAAGILLLVVPPAISQGIELWRNLPLLLDRAQSFLVERGIIAHPVTVAEALANAPEGGGSAVSTVVGTVGGLVGGVIGLFTLLILTFYLLVDRESMIDVFLAFVPDDRREAGARAANDITQKVAAWLMGHVILGAVMGGATAIGLFLIGVPYFYVLAVLAAAGELIPIIGPLLAGSVAVAVAASVSLKTALVALVYFLILQQIEGNVLVPKVMERQVGLSPAAVMIALIIGGELHGVVGAVLAMPTTAIIKVVYLDLTSRRTGCSRHGTELVSGEDQKAKTLD